MKKILVFSLVLMLALSLAGCGEDETASSAPDTSSPVSADDGVSRPDADDGQSNVDDGTIDLDLEPEPTPDASTTSGDGATTTTTSETPTDGTTAGDATAPTAGDFNDRDNWIEVPLG